MLDILADSLRIIDILDSDLPEGIDGPVIDVVLQDIQVQSCKLPLKSNNTTLKQ